jgi:hypothetical protein
LRGEARERCDGRPCASQPVRLVRAGVVEVSAGFGATCIRRSTGAVMCWGRGEAAAPPPHLLRTGPKPVNPLSQVVTETRWRAAAIKRLLHTNLVAPLEVQ